MNKITALKELTAVMANVLPNLAQTFGFEGNDLNLMIRYVDLFVPPTYPMMQAGEACLTWGSVRSLLTTEAAPWFWNHISFSQETKKFTSWGNEKQEINQYSKYDDAVCALLQYAASVQEIEQ